jgi:F1F0 ATPase subunit 2
MNEYLLLAGVLIIGMFLGLIYFGGLWLTVQRMPNSRSPMLLTIGSFLIRAGLVLGVFFLVVARSMVASDCMPGRLFADADDPDVQNASDDEIER